MVNEISEDVWVCVCVCVVCVWMGACNLLHYSVTIDIARHTSLYWIKNISRFCNGTNTHTIVYTQCFTTELILTHHYCEENCRSYNHTLRSPLQPSSLLPHISSSGLSSSSYNIHWPLQQVWDMQEVPRVQSTILFSSILQLQRQSIQVKCRTWRHIVSRLRPSSDTETLQLEVEVEVIYLHGHCMVYSPVV